MLTHPCNSHYDDDGEITRKDVEQFVQISYDLWCLTLLLWTDEADGEPEGSSNDDDDDHDDDDDVGGGVGDGAWNESQESKMETEGKC